MKPRKVPLVLHAHHALLLAVLGPLCAQSVSVSAAGRVTCNETVNGNAMTQSLPPGSPLPNGTTVGSQPLCSVAFGVFNNVSASVLARYTVTSTATESANFLYPPYSSSSSLAASSTFLTISASQPQWAQLQLSWSTNQNLVTGSTSLAVDVGNDGSIDWNPFQSATISILVPLRQSLQVRVDASAQASPHPFGGISGSTTTGTFTVTLAPASPPTRCMDSAYTAPCSASVQVNDLGAGLLTITPNLAAASPGDPLALVLGRQQQNVPLPLGGCTLAVVPAAVQLTVLGSAPPTWVLGPAPPGAFTFELQVVGLSNGVYASDARHVACQ